MNNSKLENTTASTNSEWISFNVGGKRFTTTLATIRNKEPTSMLAVMFARNGDGYAMQPSAVDEKGAYLIDRSPVYFEPILNYLRHGEIIIDENVNVKGVLKEAEFYGVESMIAPLTAMIAADGDTSDRGRDDMIAANTVTYLRTREQAAIRFRGVNLAGLDLSDMELSGMDFTNANLSKCKLIGADMRGCGLVGADLSYANLKGADMGSCNLYQANLSFANLENTNLHGTTGRCATMKGANMEGHTQHLINRLRPENSE